MEIQNGKTSNLQCEIRRRPSLLDTLFTSKLDIKFSKVRGRGSSVGIATELRAGRSGIESWWGRDFPPFRPALGPTQPPVQWIPGLSRG